MGIGSQIVTALIREHQYKPLSGRAVLIGRQTVYFTIPDILSAFKYAGIRPAIDTSEIEIDKSTIDRLQGWQSQDLINDTSLLRMFGLTDIAALDHSSYEAADIVHDLRYPLPSPLHATCDILIDGSTLDNVFTPSVVLRSFAELLRPGGRMFLVNTFSSAESAYVIMPPMWYFDYFIVNGFVDCRVYVLVFSSDTQNVFFLDLQEAYNRRREMGHFHSTYNMATLVFADKGPNSTADRLPIQQHYRPQDEWAIYQTNLAAMLKSERPHLARSTAKPFLFEYPGGFKYINRDFEKCQ
jgi:hypothetical protein